MTVCVGIYPDGTQLGTAGSAAAFVTTAGHPVAYMTQGATCAGSEVTLYTQAEADALRFQLKPQEMTSTDVQDRVDLFWMLLLALVMAWGMKQILRLFTGDTDRG